MITRRLIRPFKRFVGRLLRSLPGQDVAYWERRRHMRYYREVIRLARAHAPGATSVLDVGARDTPVVIELDWIPSRTAIDYEVAPNVPGVVGIKGDFMDFQPDRVFDLVICLQVLEHLAQPQRFAKKLLETGRTVIISVPHLWPEDFSDEHLQDPIDEAKLIGWTQQPPIDKVIVTDDRLERFIGVFEGVR
jgi:hypothetical protein